MGSGGCFYEHPLVGVYPEDETTDDLLPTALLASLFAGGSGSTDSGGSTAPPEPALILFTGGTHNGDLRNGQPTARAGADLFCQSNRPVFTPDNSCTNVRAFVSLSATDEIRDMPANYDVPTDLPIHGPNGGASTRVANNWADLLNPAIPLQQNLAAAGISNWRWFSFSNSDGSFLAANGCSGGTVSATGGGRYGDSDTTAADWISDTNVFCSDGIRILCACY